MALITAISGVGGGVTAATVGAQVNLSVAAPVAQTAQTGISGIANSQTTYTSGTVSLSELGAITIRSTTGNQYQFSVPAGASATGNLGAIAASNSTYTSGTVVLSGSGALTASYNAGTILLSVNAQTAQTFVSGIAASNTTYTSGVVSITGVGGGVTVSSNTGQRVDISVAAPVAQTVQTLGIYASSQTFGGTSSSTYSAQSLSIYASGGISVGWSNGSLGLSVPAGASATGNLGGIAMNAATTYTSGTVVLSAGANITLGSNAQTITISGNSTQSVQTQGQMSAGISNLGNTVGSTGISGTQLVLVGTGDVTLSGSTGANGATVSIVPPGDLSFYHANSAVLYSSATSVPINTSVSLVRFVLEKAVSFSRVDIPVSVSLATAATTATNAIVISAVGVLYSRNASTLNAIVGQSSTTTISYASNTGVFSSLSGPRLMSFNLASRLSAGEYYFGFQLSTNTSSVGASTTNLGGTIGMIYGSTMTAAPWRLISADPTVSTINEMNPMQGMNSVSISATSQTHQASQVTVSGTQLQRAGLMVILRNVV
jgi:hypothetical protein